MARYNFDGGELAEKNRNLTLNSSLKFCGSPNVGRKVRKKNARLAIQSRVSPLVVSLELRTSTIPLATDKKVTVKIKHLPIISACALTTQKSQGGTFDQIVYGYDKTHPQQLVYVALSRVTSIQGLFIVSPHDEV